jgi:hypothetical protein
MNRPALKIRRITHFRIVWRGISIKLKYHYQYTPAHPHQDSSDHISIYVTGLWRDNLGESGASIRMRLGGRAG